MCLGIAGDGGVLAINRRGRWEGKRAVFSERRGGSEYLFGREKR